MADVQNNWRIWFHSSRVKFPSVKTSASWCLVSTNLIWILRSTLLWNNQSRSTLWVLDTCLIVGLLPPMIISITASLSSKKCAASQRIEKTSRSTKRDQHYSVQDCSAGLEPWFGVWCACLMWCYATSFLVLDRWCCWIGSEKNDTLLDPISKDQELDFHPLVNLHLEKQFQLLNCVKLKSVSCTSNLLARTCVFRICTRVLLMLILSLQDLQQNQKSWSRSIPHCWAVFPTWQCCFNSHVWWMFEIKRTGLVSHALVHFFDSTSKFVHRPQNIRSVNARQIQAFQNNVRANRWHFSDRSHFFFLELVVVNAWCSDFV